MLDWLGCDAEDRAAQLAGLGRWSSSRTAARRAPMAPSSIRSSPPRRRDLLAACRAEAGARRRGAGRAAGDRDGGAVGRAAPPRRPGRRGPTPARKEASGRLDYDDLIGRTSTLLVDPGAAWVLYKLDGGLDHLLLDEVQDTAPAQWRIAEALTAEFFAGLGARPRPGRPRPPRTRVRRRRRASSRSSPSRAPTRPSSTARPSPARRAGAGGGAAVGGTRRWRSRSAPPRRCWRWSTRCSPIRSPPPGWRTPGSLRHFADRAGACRDGGTVAARAAAPAAAAPQPWTVPERLPGPGLRARRPLAETLARWIAAQIGTTGLLAAAAGVWPPGDVLVLVRRRNAFARALVRALKSRRRAGRRARPDGADRAAGGGRPAGRWPMRCCCRSDDLTFACLLTSPLGGLTDPALMDLAMDRDRPAGRGAARPRRRTGGLGGGLAVVLAPCWPGSTTPPRTRCWPRRWGRSAGGRVCSPGWGRRRRSRSTSCSPPRWSTAAPIRPPCRGSCTGCAAPPPR